MHEDVASLPAIAGVAITQTGCGTTCNLAGGILHPETEPRVYGGVIRDVEILDTAISGDAPNGPVIQGNDKGAAVEMAALVSLAVADPMLSLIADTLTLAGNHSFAGGKGRPPAGKHDPQPPNPLA
jgi:hypothetical protein